MDGRSDRTTATAITIGITLGAEEKFAFVGCEKPVERFLNEVRRLSKKKEPV
ncbi:MAG TPA: hypothetical protein VF783_14780 [Terriglobales bacterium]